MIKDSEKSATKGDIVLLQKDVQILQKKLDGNDKKFNSIDKRFEQVDKRFEQIDKRFEQMVTRIEHQEFVNWVKENMYTKADHARDMELIDEAMTEIRDSRDERVLSERHLLRLDDKVFDHDKRIGALEDKATTV